MERKDSGTFARFKFIIATSKSWNYSFFRKFFAGATSSLKDRLDDLKFIYVGGTLKLLLENAMVPDENRLIRVASLFDIHLCEWNLALRGYIKLAKLRRDKYGEEHELVADPYSAKAAVLLKLGKQKDASIAFAVALQIYTRKLWAGSISKSLIRTKPFPMSDGTTRMPRGESHSHTSLKHWQLEKRSKVNRIYLWLGYTNVWHLSKVTITKLCIC